MTILKQIALLKNINCIVTDIYTEAIARNTQEIKDLEFAFYLRKGYFPK